MIKKADIILSVGIIAVAVGMIIGGLVLKANGETVEITVDGKIYGTYRLSENRTVEVESNLGSNTVKIENGKVTVTKADCPDKYCVSHVAVENKGETVVCLPHKMIVEIKE